MRVRPVGLICRSEENADRFYEQFLGLKKLGWSDGLRFGPHRSLGYSPPAQKTFWPRTLAFQVV
jgi:catechol 2,3-dioxygenase-like lactoylglutathione lyase family enzyme